ncbi:MAG: hypothetical protein AMXMBFR64_01130 [Myxococcales bacterium]
MKRIIVPINHEPASLMAVDMACHVGARAGCDVELVHVRESSSELLAEARINEARARLGDAGIAATIHRLEGGVVQGIVKAAQNADLVLLRNHTKVATRDTRVAVSATTMDVVRNVSCPTLVVTESVTELARPLIAYNGSPQSRAAASWALRNLAPALFREATVMTVTSDENMADRLFTEIEGMARERGVAVGHYWTPGKPSDVILGWMETEGKDTDLIVMGAFGRSWLRERIFGSTTSRVLHLCTTPVLLAG